MIFLILIFIIVITILFDYKKGNKSKICKNNNPIEYIKKPNDLVIQEVISEVVPEVTNGTKTTNKEEQLILPPASLSSSTLFPNTTSSLDNQINRLNFSVRRLDEQVDSDNLTAPVQRYPTNIYPVPPLSNITNIPTQGLPDSYSFLGHLRREFDNKIMKLYGRRRYSENWDYYAVFNTSDNLPSKININSKNHRQLFDGDEVSIDMFSEHGPFRVYLNKQDEFPYSPFVMY